MVKIGFICEGITETLLVSSDVFKEYLNSIGIETVDVINAEGSANLLPHNIAAYLDVLDKKLADKVLILTDRDNDVCITKTKERIGARPQDVVIIAVKEIEAWFLAATSVMKTFLGDADFYFDRPEDDNEPFETIRQLKFTKTGRGFAKSKKNLVVKLLSLNLTVAEAAAHPNCPSAKYFIDALLKIGKKES